MKYPWEQDDDEPNAVTVAAMVELTVLSTEETVKLMQRDMGYMVTHTAVLVHSNQAALQMLVNTARGQTIPRGQCKFTDGSKFELQDIGMPQPKTPEMSVEQLMAHLWNVARELGLELQL